MRIKSNDPVRSAVAGCSGYYNNRISAVCAVVDSLRGFGYEVVKRDYDGNAYGDGCTKLTIGKLNSECGMVEEYNNWAVCSCYTMPSGKCELAAYIS